MKGGNYLTLEAIRQLARASIATPAADSRCCSRRMRKSEPPPPATSSRRRPRRNKYVLVPEPGRPDNGVVTGR